MSIENVLFCTDPPQLNRAAPLFRFRHAHPLGYRILGYIVLFSSALALLTTAVQLFSDYRLDVHAINDRMEQIERSYLQTIANSLWTFDEPQIKIQIEGIAALPDIKFVVVDTPFGQRYLSGTEPQNFAAITRSFPLDYNDGEKVAHLGTLTVSASLEGVYQRLRHRVFLILITNAVKNFLIALFILFIFQRLVTRHLGTMAEYARGLDLNSLHLPLILPRKARGKSPDELDQVTSAINEMRLSLLGGMAERKRAEEAVRESETRFRSLFEQAAVGMAQVAPDGRFMRVNDRLCAITGYPRETLQAKTYQELTHPDDMDITLKEARRLETGEVSQHALEKRYLRKDGSVVWVRRTVSTIRKPDGTLDHYIAVIEDVTARKLAEEEISKLNAGLEQRVSERTAQLQAANKELKAFSYSVSHDLRAPLRSIDGFSRILLEDYTDRLDAEGKHYLQTVRRASQRMAELIDDMLQLSRITRSEMRLAPVDLSALARNLADELEKAEPERCVEFIIEPGVIAQGDAHLMQVVLGNLFGNAWKFTSQQRAARIEFGRTTREGAPAYFVRDNGVGFDMAYSHKLFGAFQRLHTTAEFPGTGIGLATVQRVIDRHGGQVWAEGEVGHGAAFYFTLPTN